MDNKQIEKPKYKNRFVVPVFGIAFLLILTISISYGYFTTESTLGSTQHNVTMPTKCGVTVTNNTSTLSISRSTLNVTTNSNVEVNAVSTISITGGTSCSCNYNLLLYTEGDTYTRTNSSYSEFRYKVTGSSNNSTNNSVVNQTTYTDFNGFSSGTNIGSGVITGSSSTVTHTYKLFTQFSVIGTINQIAQQGKNYKYSLRFIVGTCSFQ